MHIHIQAYTYLKCLIYCILSHGEVIKYHKISVVVIKLSVRCLNTGPEDRLGSTLCTKGVSKDPDKKCSS